MTLKTLPLSDLQISWYQQSANGNWSEMKELQNQSVWNSDRTGKFRVRVQFRTPEVRKYSSLFDAQKDFSL